MQTSFYKGQYVQSKSTLAIFEVADFDSSVSDLVRVRDFKQNEHLLIKDTSFIPYWLQKGDIIACPQTFFKYKVIGFLFLNNMYMVRLIQVVVSSTPNVVPEEYFRLDFIQDYHYVE